MRAATSVRQRTELARVVPYKERYGQPSVRVPANRRNRMPRTSTRKALSVAMMVGASLAASAAFAQPSGEWGGYGMGPYGPSFGMDRGIMGGYGPGYGMDPGIMRGNGPGYGMERGPMGRYGLAPDLNLSPEQRGMISRIQEDTRRRHWELMGPIQSEQAQMNEQFAAENRDDAAISKTYRNISELRHQMFDLTLAAQKQMDAVLTREQRDKQRRG